MRPSKMWVRRTPPSTAATPRPQPFHQVGQTLHAPSVAVGHALLEETSQRRVDVTGVQQVIGELLHDVKCIDLKADLGAVPG